MKQNQMRRGVYSGGNDPERPKELCASCGYNPVVHKGKHKEDCWYVLSGVIGPEEVHRANHRSAT